MRISLSVLLALVTVALLPQQSVASTIKSWNAALNASSTDDTLSNSKVVGFHLNGLALHDFTTTVRANIKASAVLETGSSTALFTDEFAPNSGVFLRNATMEAALLPEFTLFAGAIEQNHHESPLLISKGTFPGIREQVQLPTNQWLFHLSAQQAIPTSTSLSSKNTGKESTPMAYTEKVAAQFSIPEGFFARARLNHFNFSHLTRGVAQDSRFYGNTVIGSGLGSQFLYAYHGWEYGMDFSHPILNATRASMGVSLLKNLGAPEGINQGQYFYGEIAHEGKRLLIAPRAEFYRNEQDASPAFYSSKEFGHNNRHGYGASIKVSFIESHLDLKARWVTAMLLTPQPFQRDKFQYFELNLETPYAIF